MSGAGIERYKVHLKWKTTEENSKGKIIDLHEVEKDVSPSSQ